jgi:hypothetical protein
MGLLNRTNPEATPESIFRWAIGGAIFAPVWTYLLLLLQPTSFMPHILIAMTILGAGIGALVEWQADDCTDGGEVAGGVPPADVWDRELDQGCRLVRRER